LRGLNPEAEKFGGRLLKTPRIFQKYHPDDELEEKAGSDEAGSVTTADNIVRMREKLEARRSKDRALTARMTRRGLPSVMQKRKRKREPSRPPPAPEIADSVFSHGSNLKATYLVPTRQDKTRMIKKHRRHYENQKTPGDLTRDKGLERSLINLERKRREKNRKDFRRRKKRADRNKRQLAKLLSSL
jgi:hypothetical protein